MKRSLTVCIGIVVTLAVGSLAAHHSPVMFDRSIKKTLVGTVVEFVWTNPHASIQLDVPNESGGDGTLGRRDGKPELHGQERLEVEHSQAWRQGDGRRQSPAERRARWDLSVDYPGGWPDARWTSRQTELVASGLGRKLLPTGSPLFFLIHTCAI